MAGGIVEIVAVTASTPVEGGLRTRPGAPDTPSAELERLSRDRSTLSSIDLDQEPVLQAASRGIVSACSPSIREATIHGSGWG